MVCVQMHSSSKYSRSSVLYRTDGVAVQPWPVVRAIGQQNYKRHAFVWVVMLCQPGVQPYIINRPNLLTFDAMCRNLARIRKPLALIRETPIVIGLDRLLDTAL